MISISEAAKYPRNGVILVGRYIETGDILFDIDVLTFEIYVQEAGLETCPGPQLVAEIRCLTFSTSSSLSATVRIR